MRIISGVAKGKKILEPLNKKTRPLKDMVRESIFNILIHSNLFNIKLENSNVLDLFSGVGSFGLEALSRGAKKVVFYEDYKLVIDLLTKNINNLGFANKAEIFKKNIYLDENFKSTNTQFDLVFIDPPFKDKNLDALIQKISKKNIISPMNTIIIHRNKNTKDEFDSNFKILKKEYYGKSQIIFGSFNV